MQGLRARPLHAAPLSMRRAMRPILCMLQHHRLHAPGPHPLHPHVESLDPSNIHSCACQSTHSPPLPPATTDLRSRTTSTRLASSGGARSTARPTRSTRFRWTSARRVPPLSLTSQGAAGMGAAGTRTRTHTRTHTPGVYQPIGFRLTGRPKGAKPMGFGGWDREKRRSEKIGGCESR
jgi:hypothetical protein